MHTLLRLVLFMTIPGLALFYSGMVRTKNVLATIMQQLTITCLISILWLMWGYSLSFTPTSPTSPGTSTVIGNCNRCWNMGLLPDDVHRKCKIKLLYISAT